MFSFGRSPRQPAGRRKLPRNFFSRREQVRLMLMLGSLLLVWLLMLEARRPDRWVWLTDMGKASPNELSSDHLTPKSPREAATEDQAFPPVPQTTVPEGPQDWDWSMIRDDLPFNAAETDQFLNVLDWWRKIDPQSLPHDAGPRVGCLQLLEQSDEYRGRLVRLSGTVRRAHWLTAHANTQHIPGYWRCWLFPDGSDSPIAVYALEMPDSFPKGMALRESVQFQGLFFKRWAYRAQGGTMTAPLIVARTGVWQPAPPPPATPMPTGAQTALAAAAVAILAAALAMWVFRATGRRSPNSLRGRANMPDEAPRGNE